MKKGFTLVELLAVITLLGIIALITVPVVENTNKKIKQKAYEKQKESLIISLKDYRTSNPELFLTTDSITVTLADLVREGYIDSDVKNPKTGKGLCYNMEFSIYKVSNSNYDYNIIGDELIDEDDDICSSYVYYQASTDIENPITIADTTVTRPILHKVYLKYPTHDGTLGTPYTCYYDNGEEFCLDTTDSYNDLVDDVKDHYGFDSSWTIDETNSYGTLYIKTQGSSMPACVVDEDYFMCADENKYMQVSSRGDIVIFEAFGTSFGCGKEEGYVGCLNKR